MEKIEAGDARQFTLTLSSQPDASPTFTVYNNSSVIVSSATASQSGSAWAYYSIYTMPVSPGYYYYDWDFGVSSKDYTKKGIFEVIKTDANWSGLYSNPNQIRDLYPKLDTIKGLTNEKIQDVISDADTIINLRLSRRYSVPFPIGTNSFPPIIEYLSKHITLIEMLKNQSARAGGDLPGWIEKREESLDNIFLGLETGSYTLVDSAGNVLASQSDSRIWGSLSDYHPVFTMLDPVEQQVDTDYTDELEDEIDGDT